MAESSAKNDENDNDETEVNVRSVDRFLTKCETLMTSELSIMDKRYLSNFAIKSAQDSKTSTGLFVTPRSLRVERNTILYILNHFAFMRHEVRHGFPSSARTRFDAATGINPPPPAATPSPIIPPLKISTTGHHDRRKRAATKDELPIDDDNSWMG